MLLAKIFMGIILFVHFSNGIVLSEFEQITLESSGKLLALPEQIQIVSKHIQEIRRIYPVVKEIHHDAKWIPGELIIPWNELNKNFGKYIQAINSSEYGPITSNPAPIFPDALFRFTRPYNPEILGQIIQNKFGYKNIPNLNSSDDVRNSISYSIMPPPDSNMTIYSIKKVWESGNSENKIYMRTWEFNVFTKNTNLRIKLIREYGDDLLKI